MKFLYLLFALFLAAPVVAHPVIGIADGDTLTLLVERKPVKVRLANIDAPEKKQAFGTRSRISLARLCFGKDATYETRTIDRYRRVVAVVRCDGVEANRYQVEQGAAWVYRKYNHDPSLAPAEQEARESRRGLWLDDSPLPPWTFRRLSRGG